MFYHSMYSDWNHGNAHFLRGVVKSLQKRGHEVVVYEPQNGWSLQNLLKEHGAERLDEFRKYYPTLQPEFYNADNLLKADKIFTDADVVIVHEWNPHDIIEEIGNYKKKYGFKLLFHDTHHRAVSEKESMAKYDFSKYDGALVFGEVLKEMYQKNGWIKNVWTWHEAADADLFSPKEDVEKEGDLVWIGNWGDGERSEELKEFLINPIKELGLKAKIYGVRYPEEVKQLLEDSGIEYGGYLPNYKVPEVFAKYKVTVHVPRGPYVGMLLGIPTIRPFEALACGIPLIFSPWNDAEHLFTEGKDYIMVKDGDAMTNWLAEILKSSHLSKSLAENGRRTILEKHTCNIRAEELEKIIEAIPNPKKSKIEKA